MENKDNIAGLGKNHDKAAHEHDIAKKQSEAKPAAENLDMNPYSVNKNGEKEFKPAENSTDEQIKNLHVDAEEYAKEEHDKADNWENTATDNDKPTF